MKRSWRLLFAMLAAFALVAAACGSDDAVEPAATTDAPAATTEAPTETEAPADTEAPTETEAPTDTEAPMADLGVGLTYDIGGKGDQSFNDAAFAGVDRAASDFGITFTEASPNSDGSNRAELLQLQADANDLVVAVGFLFADDVAEAAVNNPDRLFAVIDDSMLNFDTDPPSPRGENIAGLVFSEEQGSFLVGAAAALKSESGKIGFIGGVSGFGLIEKFEAGFVAGATAVNPDIDIITNYITEFPDFDGFNAPDRAKETALAMYEDGADIIYHAAGASGLGLFQAAAEQSDSSGSKVWAIGVDSDQYLTVPDLQDYILTSMLKRVDVAVYEIINAVLDGTFAPGETRYDLSVDGVGYSTSGGYLDDIADQLEDYKAQIIAGDIVVPTEP